MDEIITPKHVMSNCDCEFIEVDEHTLTELITQDKAAVTASICGESGSSPTIILKSTDDVEEFVGISHVRSSGLGNSLANSLPTCQIRRIQRVVNTLGTHPSSPTFFWIDALSVPVDIPVHKRALYRAGEIFQHASKVLVLEPWLSQHEPHSAQEALIRIKDSPWTRRLWTIEEGARARNLYFDFKGGPRSLEGLLTEFEAMPKDELVLALPKPFRHHVEKLSSMLAHFDMDIKLASKLPDAQSLDRDQLRSMLRLGYLSFPQIRLFAKDRELEESEVVISTLQKVYNHIEVRSGGDVSEDSVSKNDILERLQAMTATNSSRAGIHDRHTMAL